MAFVVSLTDKFGNPFSTSSVIDVDETSAQTPNRISINDGVDWIKLDGFRDVLFGQIIDESTWSRYNAFIPGPFYRLKVELKTIQQMDQQGAHLS